MGLTDGTMNPESSSPNEPVPNPEERIEELEAQVTELKGLVEILISRDPEDSEGRARRLAFPTPQRPSPAKIERLKHRIAGALGGVEGESIESQIGGIWLSRVTAMLFMTAIALGGAVALNEQSIAPVYKVLAGYGVAAVAIAYGLARRERQNLFAQSVLGSGLATFYFTTYAGFFLETAKVFEARALAIPILAAALIFVGAVAHVRKSQTVAGVGLFLIYYTVVLSLRSGGTGDDVFYALFTCSMVAVMALVFHFTHRWLFFSWAALIASQLTYLAFLLVKPPYITVSDTEYFWLSNGFLALTWVVFSVAAVTDARKTGEFRKTVAPMAGENSFVFLVLTWLAIREHYVEYEWAFRLGFSGMLGVFALYAHLAGPRRNYLYQIFLAKMVVMFTLALQAYLSHEWLLVAMALESFGLAFSYKRSGLVIFKMMGLGLLLLTFLGAIVSVRIPGEVELMGLSIPARWFACAGTPFVFAFTSWFYAHFVTRVRPEHREVKGQWFLADTIWDTPSGTTSMLYSAAGALVLMAITILDLGNEPALPFILAGEGVLMALLGLILRTAQVEVASVLLLVAAHVTYHTFLLTGKEGFETQEFYTLFTLMVCALTYFGGYLWERYLRMIRGGSQFEHDAIAAIPFVAATLMMGMLMQRQIPTVFVPLGEAALGVALLAGAAITLLAGMKIAGILAIGLGSISFYARLYNFDLPLAEQPDYFSAFALFIAALATGERVLALSDTSGAVRDPGDPVLRTIIVTVGSLLGLLGLGRWSPEGLTLYLLGFALAAMAAGTVFRESRYRWAALAIYLAAIGRAYFYDLTNFEPLARFVTFAALFVPLFVISWGYSLYRKRHLRELRADQHDEPASHA